MRNISPLYRPICTLLDSCSVLCFGEAGTCEGGLFMHKIKVIVNPVAGRGKSMAHWKRVERVLRTIDAPYVSFITNGVGHARSLAASARGEGYAAVMSVGGDGTLNEIVNGCLGHDIPIAVVSTGTGNDFARSAGLPADPVRAARLVMEGEPNSIDVGRFDSRYFVNATGIGLDAEVADLANRKYAHLRGSMPYTLGVLAQLRRFRPVHFLMSMDRIEAEFDAWVVSVTNGQFYGGGMNVVPGARISDGLLDIAVVGSLTRWELLKTFPKVFSGKHIQHPKVSLYRTTGVRIEAGADVRIQADGEVFGGRSFVFSIHPGAIKVFMPKTPGSPS